MRNALLGDQPTVFAKGNEDKPMTASGQCGLPAPKICLASGQGTPRGNNGCGYSFRIIRPRLPLTAVSPFQQAEGAGLCTTWEKGRRIRTGNKTGETPQDEVFVETIFLKSVLRLVAVIEADVDEVAHDARRALRQILQVVPALLNRRATLASVSIRMGVGASFNYGYSRLRHRRREGPNAPSAVPIPETVKFLLRLPF